MFLFQWIIPNLSKKNRNNIPHAYVSRTKFSQIFYKMYMYVRLCIILYIKCIYIYIYIYTVYISYIFVNYIYQIYIDYNWYARLFVIDTFIRIYFSITNFATSLIFFIICTNIIRLLNTRKQSCQDQTKVCNKLLM